jgi:peroxiredoxin Q/BCP
MAKELGVGDRAPDFDLSGDAGARLSLRDQEGRILVLYFYPQDDTEACTFEAIAFNRLKTEFRAAGAEIVGVSPDSLASHQKFKQKHALSLTLASDEEKKVLHAYGVWREKSMFGRKYMGVERTTFLIGPDGAIARIWRKVRTPGHAEQVLAAAQALAAPEKSRSLAPRNRG